MCCTSSDACAAPLGDAFAVERELAGASASRVFVARPRDAASSVVVKAATPQADDAERARFLQEIAVTRRMRHPALVPVLSEGVLTTGTHAGCAYYTMPYLDGGSLRERLNREGVLPPTEALRVAGALADALHHVHRRGVVHRDVKPENVLLSAGRPVLIDFGIACAPATALGTRITGVGLLVGTPTYMSPEQCAGDAVVDGRADVYALGCVLYEMLTGAPPFSGRSDVVLCRRLAEPAPRPRARRPELPADVDAVVERALAPLPSARFPSAAAFAAAIRRAEVQLLRPASSSRWRTLLALCGSTFVGA